MNTIFRLGTSREVLETSSKTSKFFGNAFLPKKAFVPIGYKDEPDVFFNVYKASKVREGQLIARGDDASSFAYIHSPIPGIVTDFRDFELKNGKVLKTMEISLEGSFDILGKERKCNEWQSLSKEELAYKIERAGILNTSSRIVKPLSITLKDAREKHIDNIATTLCDFYPSQSLDVFLGEERVKQVVEGALIACRIIEAKKIVIFHNITSKKKLLAYSEMLRSLCGELSFELKRIKKMYPLHMQLKPCVFIDGSTATYVYESVSYDLPLTSIYLSLQGSLIPEPKIFRVKIGTPISNLVEECGQLKKAPRGFIINGLTSGYAIKDWDVPITKEMKSIHIVSKEMLNFYDEMDCINCGKCFNACPCHLDPIGMFRAIKKKAISPSILSSIKKCDGCSCCSIVCPARINLSKVILSYKDGKNV